MPGTEEKRRELKASPFPLQVAGNPTKDEGKRAVFFLKPFHFPEVAEKRRW